MTSKIYKSAMGKPVDLGALLLQNEHVRAVGNMNVNARGDILDGANKVIDQKNRQVQRQYQRMTTNVSAEATVQTSNISAKQAPVVDKIIEDDFDAEVALESLAGETIAPVTTPEPVAEENIPAVGGGLAAAIARSRTIKQEKEKTLKERQQAQGLRKI